MRMSRIGMMAFLAGTVFLSHALAETKAVSGIGLAGSVEPYLLYSASGGGFGGGGGGPVLTPRNDEPEVFEKKQKRVDSRPRTFSFMLNSFTGFQMYWGKYPTRIPGYRLGFGYYASSREEKKLTDGYTSSAPYPYYNYLEESRIRYVSNLQELRINLLPLVKNSGKGVPKRDINPYLSLGLLNLVLFGEVATLDNNVYENEWFVGHRVGFAIGPGAEMFLFGKPPLRDRLGFQVAFQIHQSWVTFTTLKALDYTPISSDLDSGDSRARVNVNLGIIVAF